MRLKFSHDVVGDGQIDVEAFCHLPHDHVYVELVLIELYDVTPGSRSVANIRGLTDTRKAKDDFCHDYPSTLTDAVAVLIGWLKSRLTNAIWLEKPH
ncbi:hypothetical protein D3C78_1444450 [compost metagenome]